MYRNTGSCRNAKCNCIPPKKTCQAHSRYGSCPSESICEHRHPSLLCFNLQNSGYCQDGDRCRMRHPVEYGQQFPQVNRGRPFSGQGAGRCFNQGGGGIAGAPNHPNHGQAPQLIEEPNHSPGSPFLAPGEPWSPPYQYNAFQNQGRGQGNQF